MESNQFHKNSQEAFEQAIERGSLSTQESWENFAGNYMYMYSESLSPKKEETTRFGTIRDWFKNINTRHYYAVTYLA